MDNKRPSPNYLPSPPSDLMVKRPRPTAAGEAPPKQCPPHYGDVCCTYSACNRGLSRRSPRWYSTSWMHPSKKSWKNSWARRNPTTWACILPCQRHSLGVLPQTTFPPPHP